METRDFKEVFEKICTNYAELVEARVKESVSISTTPEAIDILEDRKQLVEEVQTVCELARVLERIK